MLFYKCCHRLLLRMVSPQMVGLILLQLIGVVLNIQPSPRETQEDSFNFPRSYSYPHPTVRVKSLAIEVLQPRFDYLPFISERIHPVVHSKTHTSTEIFDKKSQHDNLQSLRTTQPYIVDRRNEYDAIDLGKLNYEVDASIPSHSYDRGNGLEVRSFVYDDLPPLPINPTFNAKRYRKVNTSAKPSNPVTYVQYKQAHDININVDGNEKKSLGSDFDNAKFSDRETSPLQYKRAFRLQNKIHARKKIPEKIVSSSLPTTVERSWKNLKRLNSELRKYTPPTNSSLEDSLNPLVDKNKSHISFTITKEKEDSNLFKSLANFPDVTHKKSLVTYHLPNFTRSKRKHKTSPQNQTSLLSEKDLNYSPFRQDVNQVMVNSSSSSETQLHNTDTPNHSFMKKGTHINTTNNKTRQARKRNLFTLESFSAEPKNETIQNTLSNKLREASGLFNYSYNISAMDRGSLFPHDPFEDNKDFGKRSLFATGYSVPNFDILPTNSSSTKKSSVYEALRPRLRSPPPPSPTSNTWLKKLSNLISVRKYQLNVSIPQEKVVLNFNRKDDEMFSTSTLSVEITFLPTPETTKEELSSTSDLPKTKHSNYSTESSLKTIENVTSSPSIRISSRKIPDNSDFTGNVPPLETDGIRNELRISKRQRQYSGIRRPFLPETNTSRSALYVFRESQKSVTIFPDTVSFDTTSPTTLSENHDIIVQHTTFNSTEDSEAPTTVSNDFFPDRITTQPPESDLNRRPKMTDKTNSENVPFKRPKLDPKTFYDYLMKSSIANATHNFSLPEFRPGNFYRYDGIYPRKPVLDAAYSRPPPFFKIRTSTKTPATGVPNTKPTTFESKRTSIRVSSTFYPNRMQDVTMRFGNIPDPPTTVPAIHDDDPDEYRDPLDVGFTMEKLAYLLIGTCCGLSVLCLCVVVVAIKCRRHLVEQRLKAHFKSRMMMLHDPRRLKEDPSWQQQVYDPFLFMHGGHPDSSRSSNNSCNCHCVTWSLGARNLEPTNPASSTNRSSLYLCGQKKLPFGAASTLRFESMLGRKRSVRNNTPADSSPESDSLEHESSESSDGPRQCTCISYTMWPMPMPGDVRRGMYGMCPTGGHYIAGDCSHHQQEEGQAIPRDCPPPVTGSNYLDRSEGVVYWSSNDERLI